MYKVTNLNKPIAFTYCLPACLSVYLFIWNQAHSVVCCRTFGNILYEETCNNEISAVVYGTDGHMITGVAQSTTDHRIPPTHTHTVIYRSILGQVTAEQLSSGVCVYIWK